MSDLSKETDARINIDKLLENAGWTPSNKSQVLTSHLVILPDGKNGQADYVLLDSRGR